jgi:predicted GNAT superfamily acetyltransferase
MVGLVVGFLGTDSSTPERVAMARLKHCSHMLGVLPEYAGRGIGFQLKTAQLEAVVKQGVRLVTWTYDPLLSRNAHLNIRRLGAICRTYIKEVYGAMRDALNAGDASDRFQVDWWVTSPRVASRIKGKRAPLDLAHFLAAGAQELNPASLGSDDLPRPCASPASPENTLALVEIPSDYPELRALDAHLGRAWREQTRSIFTEAFDAGYIVTDFVHLKGGRLPRSYYVLSHGESTLG